MQEGFFSNRKRRKEKLSLSLSLSLPFWRGSFYTAEGSKITQKFKIYRRTSLSLWTLCRKRFPVVASVTRRLTFAGTASNYNRATVPLSFSSFFHLLFFMLRIARWHQRPANSSRRVRTNGLTPTATDEINRPEWRFNYRESWVFRRGSISRGVRRTRKPGRPL